MGIPIDFAPLLIRSEERVVTDREKNACCCSSLRVGVGRGQIASFFFLSLRLGLYFELSAVFRWTYQGFWFVYFQQRGHQPLTTTSSCCLRKKKKERASEFVDDVPSDVWFFHLFFVLKGTKTQST